MSTCQNHNPFPAFIWPLPALICAALISAASVCFGELIGDCAASVKIFGPPAAGCQARIEKSEYEKTTQPEMTKPLQMQQHKPLSGTGLKTVFMLCVWLTKCSPLLKIRVKLY